MKRLGMLLLVCGYLALGFEAIRIGAAWLGSETEAGAEEWLMLASLPVLAWVWWRHLSPFGPNRGQCPLPENREKRP